MYAIRSYYGQSIDSSGVPVCDGLKIIGQAIEFAQNTAMSVAGTIGDFATGTFNTVVGGVSSTISSIGSAVGSIFGGGGSSGPAPIPHHTSWPVFWSQWYTQQETPNHYNVLNYGALMDYVSYADKYIGKIIYNSRFDAARKNASLNADATAILNYPVEMGIALTTMTYSDYTNAYMYSYNFV